MSHLLQMRGLKHSRNFVRKSGNLVASFTDAWIETYVKVYTGEQTVVMSHLLQMRGLKLTGIIIYIVLFFKSHLLQMRGLKLIVSK